MRGMLEAMIWRQQPAQPFAAPDRSEIERHQSEIDSSQACLRPHVRPPVAGRPSLNRNGFLPGAPECGLRAYKSRLNGNPFLTLLENGRPTRQSAGRGLTRD